MADIRLKIEADVANALAGIKQLNSALSGIDQNTAKASRGIDNMSKTASQATTVFKAMIAALSVQELVGLADAATTINNKLKSVLPTAEAASVAFQQVSKIAKETGSNFEAVGDLYQKIALQSQQLGLSQTEVARVTENFSKALAVTGTTGAAASSAIYQFGQSLGRGKVAYEDIRQLQESSSGTVAMIAKQFGMSGQEFVQAVQKGKISSEQLALAVNSLGADVNDKFGKMNKTIGQSMENIRTSFILVIDRFEKSTGVFAGVAKALGFVADHMDTIVVGATIFLAVLAVEKILAIATAFRTLNAVMKANPFILAASLLAAGGGLVYEYFWGKDGDKVANGLDDIAKKEEEIRKIADARKKTQAELTKEQAAGLENYFQTLEAKSKAAQLTGVEAEIQKAVSDAARELKISENEITSTIRGRIASRVAEAYYAEQLKKVQDVLKTQADDILQANIMDNTERAIAVKLAQFRQSVDAKTYELYKGNVEALERQRLISEALASVKQKVVDAQMTINSLGIKDLDQREQELAIAKERQRVGSAFTKEMEDQVRLSVQLAQQEREINAQRGLQNMLSGRATPMTKAGATESATGIVGRLDPRLAAEQQYQTDKAVLVAQEFESEAQRNAYLEKLRQEHVNRMNELQLSAFETQLKASGVTNTEIINVSKTTMAQAQAVTQGGVAGIQGAIGLLGGFLEQAGKNNKKAFEAQKAVAIAQTIISTYQAATQAFAAMSAIPFIGPALGFAAAATIVAAGMANVSAIRSQQYSGRALGGPVMGNQSYIVGENGPEMFTPSTTGNITRNQDLMDGGGQTVVNFNITANDTQGFDELLMKRRGLITQVIRDAQQERGQRLGA